MPTAASTMNILAQNFYTVLVSGGFSAILCAGLVWAFRTWIGERMKGAIRYEYDQKIKGIEHEYAHKLETHKAQLQAQSDVEIEKLKSELQIAAAERNIKLTTVFEKQAEVVAGVYEYVVTIESLVKVARQTMLYPSPDNVELISDANRQSVESFNAYFNKRKIYVPKHTAKQIYAFIEAAHKLVLNFALNDSINQLAKSNQADQWATEVKIEIEQLGKQIPVLLETLEDDFQRILGFPIADETKPDYTQQKGQQ